MDLLKKVKYIVIHHTHTKKDSVKKIREFHKKIKGWEDIGYHWVIGNKSNLTKDGKIYKARSEKFVGSHVYKHNKNSIGIALIGNFDIEKPSKKQIEYLLKLIKQKIKKYNIKIKNILGHNEFKGVKKTCPGKNFNIEKLRKELKAQLSL
jgi:N-acetylmuramoyl-L-alanine amidase